MGNRTKGKHGKKQKLNAAGIKKVVGVVIRADQWTCRDAAARVVKTVKVKKSAPTVVMVSPTKKSVTRGAPKRYGWYVLQRVWEVVHPPGEEQFLKHSGDGETTLFHGTRNTSVANIIKESLRPSSTGLLGPGIYLAPDFHKAWGYGGASPKQYTYQRHNTYHRHNNTVLEPNKMHVLVCRVRPGRCSQDYGVDTVRKGDTDTYIGVKNKTKTWGGTLISGEYCVKDPTRVIVLSILEYVEDIAVKKEFENLKGKR